MLPYRTWAGDLYTGPTELYCDDCRALQPIDPSFVELGTDEDGHEVWLTRCDVCKTDNWRYVIDDA